MQFALEKQKLKSILDIGEWTSIPPTSLNAHEKHRVTEVITTLQNILSNEHLDTLATCEQFVISLKAIST